MRFLNLVAGLAILAAALAMFGASFAPALDMLAHFAYPLLIAAALCFGASLLLSRGWAQAQRVVASLALIACLAFTGPELAARLAPRTAPAGDPQLRVMTYNVFWLNRTPDKASAAVRSSGADVVLLVESGGRLSGVATGLRDLYPHQSYCVCGLTILSRYPIVDDLPRYARRPGQFVPVLTWAVIDSPAGELAVMGAHMQRPTRPHEQARDQRILLNEAARFDRRSLILMGDFNATPWSVFLRRQDEHLGLERRTRGLPTWPARLPWAGGWRIPFPMLPIDHVYAGSDWRTLSVRRGPSGGSDHYPVIVTLARRSGL